jgi:hypothetical protein
MFGCDLGCERQSNVLGHLPDDVDGGQHLVEFGHRANAGVCPPMGQWSTYRLAS